MDGADQKGNGPTTPSSPPQQDEAANRRQPADAWKDARERTGELDDWDDLATRDPGPDGPEPRPDLHPGATR